MIAKWLPTRLSEPTAGVVQSKLRPYRNALRRLFPQKCIGLFGRISIGVWRIHPRSPGLAIMYGYQSVFGLIELDPASGPTTAGTGITGEAAAAPRKTRRRSSCASSVVVDEQRKIKVAESKRRVEFFIVPTIPLILKLKIATINEPLANFSL